MTADALTSPEIEAPRRRIVVGVDGSDSSADALLWAQKVAPGLDAEIDAVVSWQFPVSYGMSGAPMEWDPSADAAQLLANGLKAAFGDAPPAGLRSIVVEGHPTHALLDAAEGAELLIVGSRGHGGFVGLLIGATSAYCAEHAPCAVLVAHTKP